MLPVSDWTRTSSYHDKRDRYFSDGWWSKWSPPPIVPGNAYIGWERRKQQDRIAPLLKVAEPGVSKFTEQWRSQSAEWHPQSGYVDENDYRGLGEGPILPCGRAQ